MNVSICFLAVAVWVQMVAPICAMAQDDPDCIPFPEDGHDVEDEYVQVLLEFSSNSKNASKTTQSEPVECGDTLQSCPDRMNREDELKFCFPNATVSGLILVGTDLSVLVVTRAQLGNEAEPTSNHASTIDIRQVNSGNVFVAVDNKIRSYAFLDYVYHCLYTNF